MTSMKKLSAADRVRIVACLVEGCSIRSTCRMTGFAKGTVIKLLVELGEACQDWHDEHVTGLRTERVQCDEIWSFCGAKAKSVAKGKEGHGDLWTWVALDADTKLAISWVIGDRDGGHAWHFMHDLAGRLNSRVQLTTDGFSAYLDAVIDNFGPYVDYAQLVKLYGDDPRLKGRRADARYSPGKCLGTKPYARIGIPEPKHISTSFVERQNLTMRMGMRRYTRLTNAFSKKVANHSAMTSLHFMYYNFCRVHQTLRVTPAMEAGIADHVWEIAELVGILEERERAIIGTEANERGPYKAKTDR